MTEHDHEDGTELELAKATSPKKFNKAQDHARFEHYVLPPTDFGHQWVDLAQNIFELTLLLLTILICIWDVAIPTGIAVTLWPEDGEFSRPTFDDRPWRDTPLWFNYNKFRNEFGVYWILLVSVHVICAVLAFPSYAFQLFSKKGGNLHKTCGVFILVIVTTLWVFGGLAAAIVVVERGFNPFAYRIKGQDHQTSFGAALYLQFAYDGALLNECLVHGIAARMLIAPSPSSGDAGKTVSSVSGQAELPPPRPLLQMWHIMSLTFISVSSIFLYICRTCMMGYIIIEYDKTKIGAYILFGMMLLQSFLLPGTQVKNIRFCWSLYTNFDDPYKIPRKILIYHHGSCLSIAGFVVLWTFIANIFYAIPGPASAIAYFVVAVVLLFWFFGYVRKCGICKVGYGCDCSCPNGGPFCCKCITWCDTHPNDPDYLPLCCCSEVPKCQCKQYWPFVAIGSYLIIFVSIACFLSFNNMW